MCEKHTLLDRADDFMTANAELFDMETYFYRRARKCNENDSSSFITLKLFDRIKERLLTALKYAFLSLFASIS